MNSRLKNGLDAFDQLISYVEEHKIPVVTFSGDLFHSRGVIQVQTWNEVLRRMKILSRICSIVLVPGNHDQATIIGEVHALEALKELDNIYVLDTPSHVVLEGVTYCGMPYTKDVTTSCAQIESLTSLPNPKVLLLHQGVAGAFATPGFSPDSDLTKEMLLSDQFTYVLLGDYHMRQFLSANAFYVGALWPHNFNDVGSPKGFVDVNIEEDTISFIESLAPRFVDIDLTKLAEDANEWAKVKGNIVRVRVPEGSNVVQIRERLLAAEPFSIAIDIQRKTSAVERIRIESAASLEEAAVRFLESPHVDKKGLDESRLRTLGVEYLSKVT